MPDHRRNGCAWLGNQRARLAILLAESSRVAHALLVKSEKMRRHSQYTVSECTCPILPVISRAPSTRYRTRSRIDPLDGKSTKNPARNRSADTFSSAPLPTRSTA